MNTLSKLLLLILFSLSLISCKKGSSDDDKYSEKGIVIGDGDAVDNTLHMAFKTPDCERKIDCTHLDLVLSD